MFRPFFIALAASTILTACGGSENPWKEPGEVPVDPGPDDSPVDLPGSSGPSASDSITRYEPRSTDSAGQFGDGYVSGVSYDARRDRFSVDGLAFDGDNVYTRGKAVASLGTIKVFEGKPVVPDSFSGEPVSMIKPHRALYGVSKDGSVDFAIVRTGGYVGYGFGGFVYNRRGGVTLPSEGAGTAKHRGFAQYSGDYAGIRDFENRADGQLEYTSGKMEMSIDFDDFNEGNGVGGRISDRRIFDQNGRDITQSVLAAYGNGASVLPAITFSVGPGVMNDSGEISGNVSSNISDQGSTTRFESGKYYAVVGGENAQNVVGIVVIDPRADERYPSTNVRETGGFVLARGERKP